MWRTTTIGARSMGYKIILTLDRTLISEYTSESPFYGIAKAIPYETYGVGAQLRSLTIPRILIRFAHEYKSLAELRIDPYLRIMEECENPLGIATRGSDKNVS